jgi:hypothetical protein
MTGMGKQVQVAGELVADLRQPVPHWAVIVEQSTNRSHPDSLLRIDHRINQSNWPDGGQVSAACTLISVALVRGISCASAPGPTAGIWNAMPGISIRQSVHLCIAPGALMKCTWHARRCGSLWGSTWSTRHLRQSGVFRWTGVRMMSSPTTCRTPI